LWKNRVWSQIITVPNVLFSWFRNNYLLRNKIRGITFWASLIALFHIILFALPCWIWHVGFMWFSVTISVVIIPAKGERCQREDNSATVCQQRWQWQPHIDRGWKVNETILFQIH
jgi:hypothetical protein